MFSRAKSSLVRMLANLSRSPRRRSEAAELPSVRFKEDRLETFDLALLLETRVVLDRLVEHRHGLPFAASHRRPKPDEKPEVCHVASLIETALSGNSLPHGAVGARRIVDLCCAG
jgi:hypothetical protein